MLKRKKTKNGQKVLQVYYNIFCRGKEEEAENFLPRFIATVAKKEAKRRSHFSSSPVVVFSSFDCSTARLFCISFLGTTCQL